MRMRAWCVVLAWAGVGLLGLTAIATDVPSREGEDLPVHFVVVTPPIDTTAPGVIYCSMRQDGWPDGGRELRRVSPGVYAATFELPPGQLFEYKFQREKSWLSVEKGPEGGEIPNRRLKLSSEQREVVVVHEVPRWADQEPPPWAQVLFADRTERRQARPPSSRSGDIRDHKDFESHELKNRRDILVYVPPGYDESPTKRYPVLYMHDGQNIFDAATAFAGVEWGVDEAAERLIKSGAIAPCIVVGIENTPARADEYTPFADAKYGGGDGDAYLTFIAKTVKPFIDQRYRTLPDRAHTYIAGSSLGGLISLYAACEYSETFSRFGVIAPSIWWSDFRIMTLVRETKFPADAKLWVEVGRGDVVSREEARTSKPSRYLRTCRELSALLEKRGLTCEGRQHYAEYPGAFHDEGAWAARCEDMLVFLIGPGEKTPE